MGANVSLVAAGAIVVEWNVHSDVQGGAGMWDSHIRYAGHHCSCCKALILMINLLQARRWSVHPTNTNLSMYLTY